MSLWIFHITSVRYCKNNKNDRHKNSSYVSVTALSNNIHQFTLTACVTWVLLPPFYR